MPTAEVCNDVDDDCNGVVDGFSQACSTACGTGVRQCSAGTFSPCSAPSPRPEVCNGVDDDCDGVGDATDPDAQASCPGTASPFMGGSCGVLHVDFGTSTIDHPEDPARFGCVENYPVTLSGGGGGGGGGGNCDPGYACIFRSAAPGCARTDDCWWVICSQRGC